MKDKPMTNTKKKYVRDSKARFENYYRACGELTSRWHRVFESKLPEQPAFSEIRAWIIALDITLTNRTTLIARSWALRDYACRYFAHWQLYLDGVKLPDNKVPSGCYHRVTARHNWVGTDLPFFKDEPPQPIGA